MNNFEKLYPFLEEYAEFLKDMEEVQQEKLNSLLAKDLLRIEKSIVSQQAYAMQFDSMEKKRARLQAESGFADRTFSELIELASDDMREDLRRFFNTIQASILNIKHLNDKATQIADENLRSLNLSAEADAHDNGGDGGFVETKI